jgi:hypothetical protein
MTWELARTVADAVLYEGYILYPYRASAQKNQIRWQWGVLAAPADADAAGEPSTSQTEVLVEPRADTVVRVGVRFLQVQHKSVEQSDGDEFRPVEAMESDGELLSTWDEGVEHEVVAEFPLAALFDSPQTLPIEIAGGREAEAVPGGRIVRERWPVSAVARISAERVPGPYDVVKLRVSSENTVTADGPAAGRDEALRRSLVAAHTLIALRDGAFVSLLEHPEWATPAVAACTNVGTWPVLVGAEGSRDVVLSSPIILYDYPAIAPESPGELFDGTEIDEILTLRTMALTDEEKREARGTDARAAALLDRVDTMPPEILERLHGAIRSVHSPAAGAAAAAPAAAENVPWWDPGADSSVSPQTDHVLVGAVPVSRGSRVRLRPGLRRTDAQDMFLAGRVAQVEAVFLDVDDNSYLAVTLTDDPAADLQKWHGRYLYFHPDEVEPL